MPLGKLIPTTLKSLYTIVDDLMTESLLSSFKFASLSSTKEIQALIKLLDDPDQLIYEAVSDKILHYGSDIVGILELHWENESNQLVQARIEDLIQKVNLNEVKKKLTLWEEKQNSSLIDGIILLSQYMYPNLNEKEIHKTIKSIHSSCWLELNQYLTPLEEIHILNSIIYSMYKFSSAKESLFNPNAFYINEVLHNRSGNQYSIALVYQLIASMLDIPIFAMKVSNFVLLGYYDTVFDFTKADSVPEHKTQFFIEPTEGTVLSHHDVQAFIKKYEIPVSTESFKPLKNKAFLKHYLEALKMAYAKEQNEEKVQDIDILIHHLFPKDL